MNLLDHLGTLPNSSFIILIIILITGVIFIDFIRQLVLWFIPDETLDKWKSFPEKTQVTILIILLTIGFATLSIDAYNRYQLRQKPLSEKFNIVKKDDKLTLKSKTEYYKSITVRILNETKNAYVVEYHGKLQYIDK
jgi:hypothetical protein